MTRFFFISLFYVLGSLGLALAPTPVSAQQGPLRIEITEGVIEPLSFAIPSFQPENAAARLLAEQITRVISADLTGTGLFREIPSQSFIEQRVIFSAPVRFRDWSAINAQALITGAVRADGTGLLTVKFRLFDVFSGQELGEGIQLNGTEAGWRRMAHKIADQVYSRITGESGYFDSRVAYIHEEGPKSDRKKRLAIMDYDGANQTFLSENETIYLAPRLSQSGDRLLYTSYETGRPLIYLLDINSMRRELVPSVPGNMAFSPRFSPDGQSIIYSLENSGNTDIYLLDLGSGQTRRLTSAPSIETAPDFSPNGQEIVFESDRSGSQQIYIMSVRGGEPRRISSGDGRYGTPVWSPRGDLIAFTKQSRGRFAIGVMRLDGSGERLLAASPLDEGPSWSPNGRVIMFTRETLGEDGGASLYSVDIYGRNLRALPMPAFALDPSWGPLQR